MSSKSATTPHPELSEAQKRKRRDNNTKQRKRKRGKKAKQREQALHEWEEGVIKGLALLLKVDPSKIKLYRLKASSSRLNKLQDLERQLQRPLTRALIDEHFPDWVWISGAGFHYGYIEHSNGHSPEIILAVQVMPWGEMVPQSRDYVQGLLAQIATWSTLNYTIKNNAAAKGSKLKKKSKPAPPESSDSESDSESSSIDSMPSDLTSLPPSDDELTSNPPDPVDEQNYDTTRDRGHDLDGKEPAPPPHTDMDAPFKPSGDMVGIGWHLSQEAGKSLVSYAFKKGDDATRNTVKELLPTLQHIATLYKDGLRSLYPGAAQRLQSYADEHGVPSIGDILDGDAPQRPFANSLTVTKNGFANFQHKDVDAIDIAFGFWWEMKWERDAKRKLQYEFSDDGDHDKTDGGEFIWGEYGIGVDFASCKGLVAIYWRGKRDFHGTMKSEDRPNHTRFGSSVQITKKGVAALRKVFTPQELADSKHNVENLARRSRVTTLVDRLAETAPKTKRKR